MEFLTITARLPAVFCSHDNKWVARAFDGTIITIYLDADARSTSSLHRVHIMQYFSLLVALCLLTPALGAEDTRPRRPNIVVIFIDDMGWADVGPFKP